MTHEELANAFYDAAVMGNMAELRRLMEVDTALIHARTQWGFTALHGVAGEENFEVTEFLLDQGADPNARNDDGLTPLHLAAFPETVDLLLRRGAVVDSRSNDGSTPLIVQAAEGEGIDVMESLLEHGADARAEDQSGATAMTISRAREEMDKVELLKRFGAI